MNNVIEKIAIPKSIPGLLGRVLAALSIVSLIRYGLEVGFSDALMLILVYYDNFLSAVFFWLEPFARALLSYLSSVIDYDLELFATWKHIFVLLWVYFFRDAATDLQRGFYGAAIFLFLWGICAAFLASVVAGSIEPVRGDWATNFAIAMVPALGALIFTVVRRFWHAVFLLEKDGETAPALIAGKSGLEAWWIAVRATIYRSSQRTAIGTIFVAIFLLLPPMQSARNAGLISFAVLVFLLALYWLWLGRSVAAHQSEEANDWREIYWQQSASLMGASMMGAFFWTFVFLVANAGLSLIGL